MVSDFRNAAASVWLADAVTTQPSYLTGGWAQVGSGMAVSVGPAASASVTYTKPASAAPSLSFAAIVATSFSWLTTCGRIALSRPKLRRIWRV